MIRFFNLSALLFVFGSSVHLFAQEATDAALNAEANEEVVEIDEAAVAKLSPLDRLRMAIDSDVNTRFVLLSKISPRGVTKADRAEMVKLLIGLLDSDYADIRARSAMALGLLKGDAAPAVPALMKLIGDPEPQVSMTAVWVPVSKALAKIGPEHCLEPLLDELAKTQSVKIVKDGENYAVQWGDRVKYYGITSAISEMGEAATSTAPVFVDLLRNGPENRRWATMFTLSKLGDAAIPAIPDYINNLDHRNFNVQVMACRALAELGDASRGAVPKLVKLMKESKMLSTRTHAAMCLGSIGPTEGVDMVELFTDMISEKNAFSQERGLIALGRLGRHAESARKFVEERLADEDFSQRPEAARTLWQITGDNKRTLEILQGLLDDPTYDVRAYAVIHEMGSEAAPIKELLAEKLLTDDASLQQLIAETLAEMGSEAKDQLDAIRACLETAPPDVAAALDDAIQAIESD